MHAYTLGALGALVIASLVDLLVLRTAVLRTKVFWISAAIVAFFQISIDGWLTKLSSPIVIYSPAHYSGIRVFFSTPIEDFVYGLAILVLTISVWTKLSTIRKP